MSKLSALVAGVAALAVGTGAVHAAGSHVSTGQIEKLNLSKRQLVVNHHTYQYGPKVSAKDLKHGARVKVFYRQWGDHRQAYRIVPMAG